MAIPRPVTKTKIATVSWGVPITDEVNRLTTLTANVDPATTPRGVVAYAQSVSPTAQTSGTTTLPFLSVNWTPVANRRYKITASWEKTQTVASDIFVTNLRDLTGGTVLRRHTVPGWSTGGTTENFQHVTNASLAGARTFQVDISRALGTGTAQMSGNAQWPMFILIEDIGPLP